MEWIGNGSRQYVVKELEFYSEDIGREEDEVGRRICEA